MGTLRRLGFALCSQTASSFSNWLREHLQGTRSCFWGLRQRVLVDAPLNQFIDFLNCGKSSGITGIVGSKASAQRAHHSGPSSLVPRCPKHTSKISLITRHLILVAFREYKCTNIQTKPGRIPDQDSAVKPLGVPSRKD